MKKDRITVRVSPNQMLCLKELTEGLDTSISCLVRTIIGDFLTKNEATLNRIIDAKNQPTSQEEEE